MSELGELLDRIHEESKRLARLLDDPHPGLSSWVDMLCRRIGALDAALAAWKES